MFRVFSLLSFVVAFSAPAAAYRGAPVPSMRAGVRSARSAFVAMSEEAVAEEEPAVAEEAEVTDAEARALQKTHTNKRKRAARPEPTVQLDELEVGATVEGVVRNVVSYGAFVDIGAPKDGMLHVSDISNSFVSNIEDVISVGDTISARIKSVDAEQGRFALIMKEAGASNGARRGGQSQKKKPDLSALANYDTKEVMKGKVVSVMDFGCFVSINDNTDGLVHISQLQEGHTDSVASVVSVGDEVDVRIIGIDMERQRVSLSMLPYSEAPAKENGEREPRRRAPRGEDSVPFTEHNGSYNGAKAMMDEEDAPSIFEHAFAAAQQSAAAKGISVPSELTE